MGPTSDAGSRQRLIVAAIVCLLTGIVARAQTGANVAVVINEESATSKQIGEYYVEKRGIPESNVIRLRMPPEEGISRAAYAALIERPIALALTERGLQDRVLYLVLTKGVPLRILGTSGPAGTAASVDSELTLLYRRMTGSEVSVTGPSANPYFLAGRMIREAGPFTHKEQDIYLVTRLDAFTVEDALALVDRALAPSTSGRILLDRRSETPLDPGGMWLVDAAGRLKAQGFGDRVDLVETVPPSDAPAAIMGYYSWGSNDPANRQRRLGLRFVPGSIAATLGGTDARTLNPPPDGWQPDPKSRSSFYAGSVQSLIGDLVAEGVTGAAGNVADPLLAGAVRPEILFPAYLAGFNLAEAYYLALPQLSWQGVVLGDPLCRPFSGSRVLTSHEIDAGTDARTGLPRLLSARRIDALSRRMPNATPEALASMLRAETEIGAGKKDAARATLEEVINLAPRLVDPHLLLGTLYEEMGDYDRALERYRQVVQLDPRHALALNNLAYTLATRKDAPAEALPLARRAVTMAPQNAQILDTLGWILHLTGDNREATTYLSEAVRRNPGAPELRVHLATVMFEIASYTAARAHLDEAVRLDPSFASREEVRILREKLKTGRY